MKRTHEFWACDVCDEEGFHYVVRLPEGTLVLDRCSDHNAPLLALRDLQGARLSTPPKRRASRETPLEDIYAKMRGVQE